MRDRVIVHSGSASATTPPTMPLRAGCRIRRALAATRRKWPKASDSNTLMSANAIAGISLDIYHQSAMKAKGRRSRFTGVLRHPARLRYGDVPRCRERDKPSPAGRRGRDFGINFCQSPHALDSSSSRRRRLNSRPATSVEASWHAPAASVPRSRFSGLSVGIARERRSRIYSALAGRIDGAGRGCGTTAVLPPSAALADPWHHDQWIGNKGSTVAQIVSYLSSMPVSIARLSPAQNSWRQSSIPHPTAV